MARRRRRHINIRDVQLTHTPEDLKYDDIYEDYDSDIDSDLVDAYSRRYATIRRQSDKDRILQRNRTLQLHQRRIDKNYERYATAIKQDSSLTDKAKVGLLDNVKRENLKTPCAHNKDVRRHNFFRAHAKGGAKTLQRRRTHKC